MYFITCFEKLDISDLGYPDTGNQRIFGYYADKEKAFQAVKENIYDIHETCYMYALIEKIPEGIHAICEERWFFKYNSELDGYEPIEEPEGYSHFTNFSLG